MFSRVSLADIGQSRHPTDADESPSGGPNAATNVLRQVLRRLPETASGAELGGISTEKDVLQDVEHLKRIAPPLQPIRLGLLG